MKIEDNSSHLFFTKESPFGMKQRCLIAVTLLFVISRVRDCRGVPIDYVRGWVMPISGPEVMHEVIELYYSPTIVHSISSHDS